MDGQAFRQVMSRWVTGISVITTQYNGEIAGFTANSFASVSVDPFLISMSITKTLYAGNLITQSGTFAVNILTKEQAEWGKLFAGMIAERVENRFEGIAYTLTDTGCPLLPNVLGWMNCKVYQLIDVGASTLVLGEVVAAGWAESGEPLVYYQRQWGQFNPSAT
jgi:flavin reductase (DIM6/NTAB) family NADH-FMN oxidoreductase RutF